MIHCVASFSIETLLDVWVKPVEHNVDRDIDQEVLMDCIDNLLCGCESPGDKSNFLLYPHLMHKA